jgi:hypothetical protein
MWGFVRSTIIVLAVCLAHADAAEPLVAAAATPSAIVNRVLPSWVRFKGEYRARWEGNSGQRFVPDADDHYLLTRLRLDLDIQPLNWFSVMLEGQDARIGANSRFPSAPPYQDVWDLRLASVELRRGDRLRLRVGRQELSLGEQRIVGPSNWANAARVFDAVRFDWQEGPLSLQAFASSVVATRTGEWNHRVDGDNLHGIVFGATGLPRKSRVELQGLWHVAPRVLSEVGPAGKLDIKTLIFRGVGDINARTHYVTEMAVQGGRHAGDRVRSAAGHWRVLRDIKTSWWKPVAAVVYDYATGDRDPSDGRSGTFDVIYPTPHDKYGLADQVGWKNIHHAEVRVEVTPRKGLRFEVKQHAWWLASARDWLYSAGGAPVVRDSTGKSGRYVGREVDLQAFWVPSKQVALGMGIGRLSPGEFLKRTTPGAVLTFPYIMLTYGF